MKSFTTWLVYQDRCISSRNNKISVCSASQLHYKKTLKISGEFDAAQKLHMHVHKQSTGHTCNIMHALQFKQNSEIYQKVL